MRVMEYNKPHRREKHDPMLPDISTASNKVLLEWLDHPNPDVVLRAKHELRIREGNGEMIMDPDQIKTLTPEGYGGDFELTMEAEL